MYLAIAARYLTETGTRSGRWNLITISFSELALPELAP
jgi:hypothetical protein